MLNFESSKIMIEDKEHVVIMQKGNNFVVMELSPDYGVGLKKYGIAINITNKEEINKWLDSQDNIPAVNFNFEILQYFKSLQYCLDNFETYHTW